MRTDCRKDMSKLLVTSRNSVKAPKIKLFGEIVIIFHRKLTLFCFTVSVLPFRVGAVE